MSTITYIYGGKVPGKYVMFYYLRYDQEKTKGAAGRLIELLKDAFRWHESMKVPLTRTWRLTLLGGLFIINIPRSWRAHYEKNRRL